MEDWDAHLSPCNFATTHFKGNWKGWTKWDKQSRIRSFFRRFLLSFACSGNYSILEAQIFAENRRIRRNPFVPFSLSLLIPPYHCIVMKNEAVLWPSNFATILLTACILTCHLPLTSRPMKWRTLSQRPQKRVLKRGLHLWQRKDLLPPLLLTPIQNHDTHGRDSFWCLKSCLKQNPITIVSKLITDWFFLRGIISDYRCRIALPEELSSITETDLF